MKHLILAALTLPLGWALLAGSDGRAAEAKAQQPLELRLIMNELSAQMQRVTAAIAREDWRAVERAAPRIASHRHPPPAERARIFTFLGSNVTKFKAHDQRTHDAAEALGAAASRRDGTAVIAAFQEVQSSCHGCHREFRKPFVEHFYGRQ